LNILILSADEVRQALSMPTAIEAVKEAYAQLSTGQARLPLRSRIDLPEHEGTVLFMPASLKETGDTALKVVSVFLRNPDRDLPTIHAMVVVVDHESGRPVAILEGASLTSIRTGAGSGAATQLLAREDASVAAIFGSGVQARTQLEAICAVRATERVWVYSIDPQGAERFAEEMAGKAPIPSDIRLAASPGEAIESADVICTATTSTTPVFDGAKLRPGVHINAIGSFTPAMQEVDSLTVKRSLLVVDSREAALEETGDLIIPLENGDIQKDWIYAEIGEIAAGLKPGRTDPDQITLFKSVGLAVQDAAAAGRAIKGAKELGIGQIIDI
jgi:ornithine cyclodeaminase